MKKITIGFLGNINYDTRTNNFFTSLKSSGCDVRFIGFDWLTENFNSISSNNISVTKLIKNKISVLFYLKFFFMLLSASLKSKADIYLASDFFSLPALFVAAKFLNKKLFYDSREIFTELPFHNNKPLVKRLIKIIERFIIKKTDTVFVTGEMDADYLLNLYGINTIVVRNLPALKKTEPVNLHQKFKLPTDAVILLYQGIVVHGRGLEIYLKTLLKNYSFYLVILGGGEHLDYYKSLAAEMNLSDRVVFAGKIKQDDILDYTAGAFAGLSIIDNISINNYYALPNKIFEYMMSGLPVIANNLPQMKIIIEKYDIGKVLQVDDEINLEKVICEWIKDPILYQRIKENCMIASEQLNWEAEFSKISYHFN